MASAFIVALTAAAVLTLAAWVARPAARRPRPRPDDVSQDHLIVLPVVATPPQIEEFAAYTGCGDRVVLSVAAGAPAEVVRAAELVAGWYGFGLRFCAGDQAGSREKGDGSSATAA